MFRNHIVTAKLFRYNPDTGEYSYHHKAEYVIGGQIIREDEWVSVSEDVFNFLRRDAWTEDKRPARESRCLKADGTRCKEDCKECLHIRTGALISLDHLLDVSFPIEDDFCLEEWIEHQELLEALHTAIRELNEKEHIIINLRLTDLSGRKIAKKIGTSQSNVRYHMDKAIKELAEKLKYFG